MELDNWEEDFEIDDKPYKDFYKENQDNMNIYFIYINSDNEIIRTKKEKFILDENKLTKSLLIEILKKNMFIKKKKYKPISLIKYNVLLEPDEVQEYIYNSDSYDFMFIETMIDDISWEKTITLFQNINSLHILFYEKKKSNAKTKKIFIHKPSKRTRKKLN
ncbi:MAG: hypothetical protein CML42_06760 [Rhodobacteraceae bacterium]|nr:hypothetical protein [Paracoccaceae bacterium]|tara:strand:+ start:140 stop:625 length:486 start_codon:yes stop_codon:yes gene_type:complete